VRPAQPPAPRSVPAPRRALLAACRVDPTGNVVFRKVALRRNTHSCLRGSPSIWPCWHSPTLVERHQPAYRAAPIAPQDIAASHDPHTIDVPTALLAALHGVSPRASHGQGSTKNMTTPALAMIASIITRRIPTMTRSTSPLPRQRQRRAKAASTITATQNADSISTLPISSPSFIA